MEFTLVNIINQIVVWFGIIMMEHIFIMWDTPMRSRPVLRIVSGNIAGLVFMMLYFPYYSLARLLPTEQLEAAMIYAWWGILYFATVFMFKWWYELSFGQVLFRCVMGLCLHAIANTFIQNFIAGLWFPKLLDADMLLYVTVNIGCYTAVGILGYYFLSRNMRSLRNLKGIDTGTMRVFLCLLLIFSAIGWDIANGIFKHAIAPVNELAGFEYIVASVRYFCAVTSILFSAFVLGILYAFYRISFLRQEEEMLKYLQNEKEKQYEFSKQNMDIINQKCHDLKRQIQALRFSGEAEREDLYQETEKNAEFFDYVVKTDNEILNTILTEKGLICYNRRIRLTCMVQSCDFQRISVIDLYTILSNAIDNAIECASKYKEESKKIISVHISQTGGMLSIMIDNYFDGELIFENGQLKTSKEDSNYHGFGMRSIQMLVKRYQGDIRISHTNLTFSLQIMLPV